MLYYYPKSLPTKINKDRLENLKSIKSSSYTEIYLYSNEGIYLIKKNKLYMTHFNDSNNSVKVIINEDEYISDTSDVVLTPCSKLPYSFIKKEMSITSYEKGSIKMILQECNNSLEHIYFEIKNNDIYGIHDDIKELFQYAKS